VKTARRFVVYTQGDPKTRADIWYLPVESGKPTGPPVQFLATDANESQGQISPDGKWLAYSSSMGSGTTEVYIRAFPTGGRVWSVSVGSGHQPRWRTDGKELYFIRPLTTDRVRLMAARIEPGSRNGLQIGAPQRLFDFRTGVIVPSSNVWTYSPHPDGRFLVDAVKDTEEPTVNVITHWQEAVVGKARTR
jgi:dipeptidyl aminopeptidase/acylaminoacyl peptidase